jgi:hypothetical protein
MNIEVETSSETLLITIQVEFHSPAEGQPPTSRHHYNNNAEYVRVCVYRLSRAAMQVTAAAGKVRDGTYNQTV